MIDYHNPKATSSITTLPYSLGIQLAGSNQVTVGLLANGFPDSENFLNLIAEVLQAEEPGIRLAHYNKGNASIPASGEILADIQRDCQAVITAYGH